MGASGEGKTEPVSLPEKRSYQEVEESDNGIWRY
jgi:hypothetical protein